MKETDIRQGSKIIKSSLIILVTIKGQKDIINPISQLMTGFYPLTPTVGLWLSMSLSPFKKEIQGVKYQRMMSWKCLIIAPRTQS
jgi:hypothetical protein